MIQQALHLMTHEYHFVKGLLLDLVYIRQIHTGNIQ